VHTPPAVTLPTERDRARESFQDMTERLNSVRLAQVGRSTQELLRSLDQGLGLAQGTASYVYLGPRIVRGWAIELLLVSLRLRAAAFRGERGRLYGEAARWLASGDVPTLLSPR